jgi:hypothetical protein
MDVQADAQAELDDKGSDCNTDEDRGLNGVQRRGLGLVRRIETRMSEQMPERNIQVEFRELIARIDTELRVRSVYMNTGLQGSRRVF